MDETGEKDTTPEQDAQTDTDLSSVSLSVDAVLSLLADHHRRDLLRYLIESPNQTASFEGCVRHILQREEERVGECPGHEQVETALHHIHLPKLEDTGILEYDTHTQELRYQGQEHLETCLDHIETGESDIES